MMNQQASTHSPRRLAVIGLLTWLAMAGVDFFIHGGVLARLYISPSPFLLPPEEAFRRIPLGYLALGLGVALLLWLMVKLGIAGWRRGLAFGLGYGAVTSAAYVLGLASIATAGWPLLIGWAVGQWVQLGIGGIVAGSGLAGVRPGRLTIWVVVFVVVLVITTIVMQNVGIAPAVQP